jgi:formylglycine-generating enzyme required for sulfatase activity
MLVTAMVVQAFGFVGSAGANTQTVEILDVQSNAISITVTYKNAFGVRVRVNGKVASNIAGSWNDRLKASSVSVFNLPTSDKITLEIAGFNRVGQLGPYVTKEVYGSFVSIGEKKDPKIKSVTTSPRIITVGWDAAAAVDYYILHLMQNGNLLRYEVTYSNSMTFSNLQSGHYTVRLFASFKDHSGSNWDTSDVEVPAPLPLQFVQVGQAGVTYTVPIGERNNWRYVLGGFWIGTTEVTYDEWYAVRTWAESNGYTFANKGQEGHDGGIGARPTLARNEPVMSISWRDIVVWSNAKSEQEKLTPVYVHKGHVLKDATSASVDYAVQRSANGYRLPTNNEWEMAARWLGTTAPTTGSLARERIATTVDGVTHYWTPGNYASGAVEDVNSASENARVAWYGPSSNGTKEVGKKAPNALGMFDVSGNVWEWTYDKAFRGGSWINGGANLPVSYVYPSAPTLTRYSVGFRLSRTVD